MSSPSARDNAAQLRADDFPSIILRMQQELKQLRRDVGQSGRSLSWTVATPAMPATTVPVVNTNSVAVTVYIRGGTVTNITVDGTALGMTSGTFRVNPGDDIAITYSVAPTWFWYGD